MSTNSPLGNNYDWVSTFDHRYASRDLAQEEQDALVVSALMHEPEVMALERTLRHKVILAVQIGQRTLHLRVYNHYQVTHRPDNLASRQASRDPATFLMFNEMGGLEVIADENLRWAAQGHSPELYADRRLSPKRIEAIDRLQLQLTGRAPKKFSPPSPSAPLKVKGKIPQTEDVP